MMSKILVVLLKSLSCMRKATLSKLWTEGKIGERINILNSIILVDRVLRKSSEVTSLTRVLYSNPTLIKGLSSVQFSSVAQSCPTLCDSMNHSTPGLPVHHQLPESTQTHVH